jgi:TFIIF-interacting CTD phosphatase-like protein
MKYIGDKIVVIKNTGNLKDLNIIFDLDETLINTKCFPLHKREIAQSIYDESTPMIHSYSDNIYYYVIIGRSGLLKILQELKSHFNIYVYTNGTYSYAKEVCDCIENKQKENIFTGIISRANKYGSQRKYFGILPNFTFNNTIIIDDRSDVWDTVEHGNLIKIREYIHISNYENGNDTDLYILKDLLLKYKMHINENNICSIINLIKNNYNDQLQLQSPFQTSLQSPVQLSLQTPSQASFLENDELNGILMDQSLCSKKFYFV